MNTLPSIVFIAALLSAIPGLAQPASAPLFVFDFESRPAALANKGTLGGNASLDGAAVVKDGGPGGKGAHLDLSGNSSKNNTLIYPRGGEALGNRENLTVAFWFRLQGVPAIYDRLVALQDNTLKGFSIHFVKNTTGDMVMSVFYNLELQINGRVAISQRINFDDRWRFAAVTFDGSRARFFTGTEQQASVAIGDIGVDSAMIEMPDKPLLLGGTSASAQDRTPPVWLAKVRIFGEPLDITAVEDLRRKDARK